MKQNFSYIYALTEEGKPPTVENIRYIGKTCATLRGRLSIHIRDHSRLKYYSACWIRSILKKGLRPEIHPLMIVEHFQASEMEIKTIALYKRLGSKLTNLTDGGEGALGCVRSKETRTKLSIANLGKTLSDEHKSKISLSLMGRNHPFYGKRHSNETKEKMSMANAGSKHPLYGKHPSAETRKKLSISKLGNQYAKRKIQSEARKTIS